MLDHPDVEAPAVGLAGPGMYVVYDRVLYEGEPETRISEGARRLKVHLMGGLHIMEASIEVLGQLWPGSGRITFGWVWRGRCRSRPLDSACNLRIRGVE